MDGQRFKQAMRHCAGAVALVTVGREGRARTGLTVTAVCSLSDDPPSLLVCVNRNASAHPRIREEGCFGVSFLAHEHMALALTFSGQKGVEGDARFAFGRWAAGVTGAPILEDALVSFDCELREAVETKTHSIFIGDIRDVGFRPEARPLIYLRGAFHDVHPVRPVVSLGDIEARRMIWSGFS
ncbi:flavin reductase family protein [Enterovirga rhinocerotis]|uniref:Flavin reductase (NADH)/cob(II)yrinic acid a,c-diamide reductase n=1 Tax=Enterovirga rhinocerotis TaxID=1339210 RepID=A0A4R7BXB9_9HYPH|nr:flavin reductase family protein [Enterovirga rhinocerotis]TDR90153.1 flavin reductase (NADH)/cob(II)yrinic acid a,c-diamide reductase [Enterovirga rhinocerotis]